MKNKITLKSFENYDFTSSEFQTLLKNSNASAFQNPLWLNLLYKNLAPQRGESSLIILGFHNEKLIFCAPLIKYKKRGLKFISLVDCEVSDYNNLIIDNNYEAELKNNPQFHYDFTNILGKHDIFHAEKCVEGEHSFDVLGQIFTHKKDFSCHRLPLSNNFEKTREEKYQGTMRRSLDKKLGKLTRKGGFELKELQSKEAIDKAFETLIEFRKGRFGNTKAHDLTQIELYQNFYKTYAVEGINTLSRVFQLSCENQPIAVTLGLNHLDENGKTTHHVVLLAYDTQNWANWSPGLAMLDKLAEQLIKENASLLDLTIGDEPYKYLFGVTSTPIHTIIRPLTFQGALYFVAYKAGSKVKRFLKKLIRG